MEEDRIYWLGNEQTGKGGIFWRGFELVQFIERVEQQKGKVVGIRFIKAPDRKGMSYNVEFLIAEKKEDEHR